MTKVLFSATDGSDGAELWVTDGTAAGTYMLDNIDTAANTGSYPLYITPLGNGMAVFSANDGTHGKELWVTNGTSAGTMLLKDINMSTGSYPGGNLQSGIVALGSGTNKAVFAATDGSSYGTDLWVTDGTSVGTFMIKGSQTGIVPENPSEIVALGNGKALFDADDSSTNNGYELWITDGTDAGTMLVQNLFYGLGSSNPTDITPIGNGKALLAASYATDSSHKYGRELMITDGTAAGTKMLKNIDTTAGIGSYPSDITVLSSTQILFAASDGTHGTELWITDGTSSGTALLKDIDPGYGAGEPHDITPLGNGKAVFGAYDGVHGDELWITDGTSGGTVLLKDINTNSGGGGTQGSYPAHITALGNGKAVLAANDGVDGTELWVTDGTVNGTYLLRDIAYGVNSSDPQDITVIGGGEALFQAVYSRSISQKYGNELFITDGTSAGTKLVKNIYPDTSGTGNSSNPHGFAVLQPVCFCRGTMILTKNGEVPVEELAVGDQVQTLSGGLKPIVWIGIGRELVTHTNKLTRPVIVRQGALGNGLPYRDLYLTHGHALYLEGVLIPVENLINHRSIVWDETARVVEYFHIELEDHDVILAEGAPAESYYDAANRARFQNVRPGSAPGTAKPTFAPVMNGGEEVDRAWIALAERAGALLTGPTTDDPDVHLVVAGHRLEPALADGCNFSFELHGPLRCSLLLCSRSGVPSLLSVNPRDHRRLGVAVKRIILRQRGVETMLSHEGAIFAEGGCHPPEKGYSWTDGKLNLPARMFDHLQGAFMLTVETECPGMRYPAPASTRVAA